MLLQERQKLFAPERKYLNIGITADGSPIRSFPVPWTLTVNAYNMRTPDVFFCRADFEDPEIIARLSALTVHGCYLFDPLDDYSFLSQFTELWDLTIYEGGAIKDLSFMSGMHSWFQLYIDKADIDDLAPLFAAERDDKLHSMCIAFNRCRIGDISALIENNPFISELHVWMACGTGSKEDEQRWHQVKARHFDYYTYPEKKC